ncbi:hypothetical protein FNV43_RR15814 [Rhamnella rubrinervis]|uniref:Galactose oxidase n=1 Tax=Rhamnella rubrinervis TaxID=2594499 RepID=A0A8K0E9L5_9ROSA|nr:hypothetical protein FNV43_RR15814 [Rhamnella rubrinervis]
MAALHKALCLLPLFFLHAYANFLFRNPFAPFFPRPHPPINENASKRVDAEAQPDFETNDLGSWKVVSQNSGVSAMHIMLLPNNKVIMYDASAFHISAIKLPNGVCIPYKDKNGNELQDCWSHGVEYDIDTAQVRPLKMQYDPWCSSGGLAVDGTLVSTGGWNDGVKTVRYISPCVGCDFEEYQTALADPRWYATQITLPNGGYFLVGGRRAYTYEYVPPKGQTNPKATPLALLDETTDLDENNLYPFVHLSTDGNIFIFANNRAILLNLQKNEVVLEFPPLQGGSRNYPASGMSALLPIKLHVDNAQVIPAEVMITKPNAQWKIETMPSPRVMGDMLILPTGKLLILNGAKKGTAAWAYADEPNLVPVIYNPDGPKNQRFKELKASQIARMYHSSAAVLPDGQILVAGSNTNPGYDYKAKFPTELRVEKFSPPYLDADLDAHRPVIMENASTKKFTYGQLINIQFKLNEAFVQKADVKVTMLAPPFTTHGYSMNQRMLMLGKVEIRPLNPGTRQIVALAPPSAVIAPPGYYLLSLVYRGVPSKSMWVQIM